MSKQKKGFTLVEVMVVLVVLAIIAAIAVPSAINYIRKANQDARIETARAVFNVAQNAMTDLYNRGDKDEMEATGRVDVSKIDPAINSEEVAKNKNYIRYISINESSDNKENNPVYKLLDDYISDKALLDDTILIEFNIKTGRVLSAFYSDEINNIGYASDNEYNVYKRSKSDLKENKTGYWAVDSTGTVDGAGINDITAELVDYDGSSSQGYDINNGNNYGLLTCEMIVPAVLPEAYNYEITLNPEKGTARTIEIGGDKAIKWNDVNSNIEEAINGNGLYLDKSGEENVLVLVLDTPYSAYSISQKFPTISIGNLTATLKVSIEGDSNTVTSGAEHGYFADEDSQGTETKYNISSIRHLNNVRYDLTSTANYTQTKDIKCRDYKNDVLIFKALAATNGTDSSDTGAFMGTYNGMSSEKAYSIFDLTETESLAGLFGKVGSEGVLKGITLDYSEAYLRAYEAAPATEKEKYFITGTGSYAGGICGINNGEIVGCSVNGGIIKGTQSTGNVQVGGIAGLNNGMRSKEKPLILGCYNGANIENTKSVDSYAGGIAGRSGGDIKYCECGTDRNEDGLIGKPYFGAGVPEEYSYSKEAKNNTITILGKRYVGGIVGYAQRYTFLTEPEITGCVNAAKVKLENNVAVSISYVGGIAGRLGSGAGGSLLASCYNAGDVDAKTVWENYTGGILGGLTVAQGNIMSSSYNTGNVYAESSNDTATSKNGSRAGGIAGHYGYGNINNCYSIGHITGTGVLEIGGNFGNANNPTRATATDNNACLDKDPANVGDTEKNKVDNTSSQFLSEEELKENIFAGMSTGGKVGVFEYIYPHLNINNTDCKLGEDFHRTPW